LELRGLRVDSFQCRNHPEREGVGICVACRRVFCVECSTKIDGVNHCRECLAKRESAAVATVSRRSGIVVRAIESLLAFGAIATSFVVVLSVFLLVGEQQAHGNGHHLANRERLDQIAQGLQKYKGDVGSFPTDAEGLMALRVRPKGVSKKKWHGPYLLGNFTARGAQGESVTDAYGTPVHYRAPTSTVAECVIASDGGNRICETEIETAHRLPSGEADAGGDDVLLFVP
jgi:hypothetical protein